MQRMIACVVALGAISIAGGARAQCSHGGGGGGSASGSLARVRSASGMNSPLASINSLGGSANGAFLTARYRSQLAQQQYLMLQQQQYMQAMAAQQQMQAAQTAAANAESTPANDSVSRRDSLREASAQRSLDAARRAEATGRLATARSKYRNVIRLVGDTGALGAQAAEALELLDADAPAGNSEPAVMVASRIR